MTSRDSSRRRRWTRFILIAVLAILISLGLYVSFVRPWHSRWGATQEEVARVMPGDDIVGDPIEITTRATSISAWPNHVWPWLAQMGKGRGGLYSYDWLDQMFGVLDGPSADTLLAAYQQIQAGDTIPVGGSPGWPVAVARQNEFLLLEIHQAGADITWAFAIHQVSPDETRLVMRVRARLPRNWRLPLLITILDPAEFLMVRRQLLGIRERAERLAMADPAYVAASSGRQP
jgi:hypothetical protein